jgi:hypothetical protein
VAVATYLAGVDIGTSGAKVMGFDVAGNPLASACQEHPCTYPRPGWVEQDADHLVEVTMDAMARAVVQSGVKRAIMVGYLEQDEHLLHSPKERGMRAFDFSVPSRVFFGNGELRRLQEIAPTNGKRALLLKLPYFVENRQFEPIQI